MSYTYDPETDFWGYEDEHAALKEESSNSDDASKEQAQKSADYIHWQIGYGNRSAKDLGFKK
jgi:hypothetical protein